jgi:SAM-dependent methyltransferase
MITMYDNLLEYYDELFPVEQSKIAFIEETISSVAETAGGGALPRILDVGCATGTFDIQLMRRHMDVTGIDNNATMIQSACRRNPEPRTNARFFRMDMREAAGALASKAYTAVLCLGNTLVHLENRAEIGQFLKEMYGLLVPGGAIVLQLVNYERILAEGIERLPSIESTRCRFERLYTRREDGRLNFEVSLFSSTEQIVFRDRTILFPLKAQDLEDALKAAGFARVAFRDSFDTSDYSGTDLGLICTAWR